MKLLLLPKQSYITQNIIVHFIILVYPVDEAIFKNDGALEKQYTALPIAIGTLYFRRHKIESLVDF